MCTLRPAALALGIAIAGLAGGCGGDDTVVSAPPPQGAATAEIRRVVALANTTSKTQFAALTAYVPEDVVVDGDSAVASYGPLPSVLEDVPGLNGGRSLDVERIAGEWRIAGLPR